MANLKIGVAASEHQERKARPMNNENEGHPNGGGGKSSNPIRFVFFAFFCGPSISASGLKFSIRTARPIAVSVNLGTV
jgi:hypothetical protein